MREREGEIIMVLVSQWRAGNHHIRQIDAFAAAQRAANLDDSGKAVIVDGGDPQDEFAIIDQQSGTGCQRSKNLRMREPDTTGVTGRH